MLLDNSNTLYYYELETYLAILFFQSRSDFSETSNWKI